MEYYRYIPDSNHYNGVGLPLDISDNILDMLWKSKRLSKSWQPVGVHGFDDNPGVDGDFPSLSDYYTLPIFSQHAWDVFSPLIGDLAEALPIIYPSGEPHYIINILNVVNCVDIRNSVVKRYSDGGIMRIETFCFKQKKLKDHIIFKTPPKSGADLIISQEFRKIVEDNHLAGLQFIEL